jgi:hypothetical protein
MMAAPGHGSMGGGMFSGSRTAALSSMAASGGHPMGSGMGMGAGMGHAGVGHSDYQQMMITQQARVSYFIYFSNFRAFTHDYACHRVGVMHPRFNVQLFCIRDCACDVYT